MKLNELRATPGAMQDAKRIASINLDKAAPI